MTADRISRVLPGSCREILLSEHTTWRIGGPCTGAFPKDRSELAALLNTAGDLNVPWTVLGRGSNTLAPSAGWSGLVIILSGQFRRFSIRGNELEAGASAPLPSLAGAACCSGLGDLSFATGIPGTLGGAVFMNAGAYGGSIGSLVSEVHVMTPEGRERILSADMCEFSYRSSVFQTERNIITGAVLSLEPSDQVALKARARELLALRREKFPLSVPNAGSVFRRPANGPPPGKLIEDAGLKGFAVGGARVSPRHANFIENCGGASSDDVLRLMEHVRERVQASSGILLQTEVRVLGERSE